ncbi:lytic transglycosylase domain-containing protein [Holospora curviuscula]|uniref:Soluble lytic murein transglycosylase n=1 Tax=Holospora curviuscula TaxID=1082868 RepID=A0A2S5R7P6_9PROT|nr:lytic transglycosylase domain-containing protein [Holospora curviuscula]PPE03307.1 Soluble lytic murein transglycosylase precursor [Holospora curviuscula]
MRSLFIFVFSPGIVYSKPLPFIPFTEPLLFKKTHAQLKKQMEFFFIQKNQDEKKILQFFSKNPPQTIQGWIRYGEVLSKNGSNLLLQQDAVRRFWIENTASEKLSQIFLRIWSPVLSTIDHERKIIYLLSTSSPQNPLIQKAQFIINLLEKKFHPSHELRIATGLMSLDARWVPFVDRKTHRAYFIPVLRRAYIRFLLRKDQLEAACRCWSFWKNDLLSQIYTFNTQANQAGFNISRALARDLIQKGNGFEASHHKSLAQLWYTKAFQIIQTTLKDNGRFPIEQSWIAGLIQFHLYHWKEALGHFNQMMKQAFMEDPWVISSMLRERYYAKAAFWCGVCCQKYFHIPKAQEYFEKASQYPFLFYGQMALTRLKRKLTMKFVHPSSMGRSRVIEGLLNLLGDKNTYGFPKDHVSLVNCLLDDLIDNFSSVQECWAFVKILRKQFPSEAVYLARKLSAHRAQYVFSVAYPTCALPRPFEDPALIWSIALGETCFSPYVVSSKGALGVMQIMPFEVEKYAKKAGLPYSLNRMKELDYGMSLGIEEIKEKLALYRNKYVLGIASYNAGTRKLNEWHKTLYPVYEPDIILRTCLWIERIPYEETRQYICKILSFYCVYRWMQGRTLRHQDVERLLTL